MSSTNQMSVVLPDISREPSRGDVSVAVSRQSHPDAVSGKTKKGKKKKAKPADPKEMAAGAEIARALANITSGSKTAAQIAEIQDLQDDVSRKLEKATDRDRELGLSLVEMAKTLAKAKQSRDGVYGIQTGTAAITKEIKNLEKRLDKARSNYNISVDENNKLRMAIETTRHEIEAGAAMLKVEMKSLTEKQIRLRELTESMQESYINRDRAQITMVGLKEEAGLAENTFRHQWHRLQRVMEDDAQRSHAEKRTTLKSKGDRMAEDKDKTKVIELEKKIFHKKKDEKLLEKQRLESIEQTRNTKVALQQIFDATGFDNVDELVAALLDKQEMINHDFAQIETVQREMDQQVQSVEGMKAVLASNEGRHVEAEGHRKKVEMQLDEQLHRLEQKASDADAEMAAAAKIEANLYPKVQRIFDLLGCGADLPKDMEPGPMDVTKVRCHIIYHP